jgi:hypothetical protein
MIQEILKLNRSTNNTYHFQMNINGVKDVNTFNQSRRQIETQMVNAMRKRGLQNG